MIDPVLKIALRQPEAAEAVGLTEGEFEGAVKRGELPPSKRYGRRKVWSVKELREAVDGPLDGDVDLDEELDLGGG